MLDTQTISIFVLARWHQFGLTEQVAILHIPGNQQFTIFLAARCFAGDLRKDDTTQKTTRKTTRKTTQKTTTENYDRNYGENYGEKD